MWILCQFLFLFSDTKSWHFMWIVCLADDLHISQILFSLKKNETKIEFHLLQFWLVPYGLTHSMFIIYCLQESQSKQTRVSQFRAEIKWSADEMLLNLCWTQQKLVLGRIHALLSHPRDTMTMNETILPFYHFVIFHSKLELMWMGEVIWNVG